MVSAAAPNAEVMAVNPLNKIPTLVLDDGTALYDSRVICEYLDTLHDGPKLFPADAGARWTALRRQALGDGLMDVIVLRLGEQDRPPASQSEKHLSAYRLKIATALDRLESEADAWRGRSPSATSPSPARWRTSTSASPRMTGARVGPSSRLVRRVSRAGRPCRPPNTSTPTKETAA